MTENIVKNELRFQQKLVKFRNSFQRWFLAGSYKCVEILKSTDLDKSRTENFVVHTLSRFTVRFDCTKHFKMTNYHISPGLRRNVADWRRKLNIF